MSTIYELQKEAMNKINELNEEISRGDFSTFGLLAENQKVEFMQNWTKETWDRFRMQNTITEEDVFNPIIKFIEDDRKLVGGNFCSYS